MTNSSFSDSNSSKSTESTLTERLRLVEVELRSAAEGASVQVAGGPDNPKIKRVGSNSFIIKASDLGNNLTPEFHDWKAQFKLIADLLKKQQFSAVRTIIETGKYRANGVNQAFAEEVLKNVKEIVGDLTLLEMNTPEPAASRRVMKP